MLGFLKMSRLFQVSLKNTLHIMFHYEIHNAYWLINDSGQNSENRNVITLFKWPFTILIDQEISS